MVVTPRAGRRDGGTPGHQNFWVTCPGLRVTLIVAVTAQGWARPGMVQHLGQAQMHTGCFLDILMVIKNIGSSLALDFEIKGLISKFRV